MVTETKTAQQAIDAGRQLAKTLHGGEVLLLTGELGSGKTTFVKGLAQGLGVKEDVTSATFLLLTQYRASDGLTLIHVDGYRLESEDDVRSIGLDDWLGRSDTIVAIEWPERFRKQFKSKSIKFKVIKIQIETINEQARRIRY